MTKASRRTRQRSRRKAMIFDDDIFEHAEADDLWYPIVGSFLRGTPVSTWELDDPSPVPENCQMISPPVQWPSKAGVV